VRDIEGCAYALFQFRIPCRADHLLLKGKAMDNYNQLLPCQQYTDENHPRSRFIAKIEVSSESRHSQNIYISARLCARGSFTTQHKSNYNSISDQSFRNIHFRRFYAGGKACSWVLTLDLPAELTLVTRNDSSLDGKPPN
jgi:hypothetical protein